LKDRVNGHGGHDPLDAQGRFGIAHNTPRMAWALKTMKQKDSASKNLGEIVPPNKSVMPEQYFATTLPDSERSGLLNRFSSANVA